MPPLPDLSDQQRKLLRQIAANQGRTFARSADTLALEHSGLIFARAAETAYAHYWLTASGRDLLARDADDEGRI